MHGLSVDQPTYHLLDSTSINPKVETMSTFDATPSLLRRATEVYDAELERMNTAMSAENQTLQNDNRQLNALIREYEQTLENVMTQFRERAVSSS